MPLMTNRSLVLAKIQGSQGVDAAPVIATDAFLVSDLDYRPDVNMVERNVYRPSMSQQVAIPGRTLSVVSFTHEIKGAGDKTKKPKLGTLLRMCGFAETAIGVDVGYKYDPVSTGFEFGTLWIYMDGIVHKIIDAMGTFTLTADAGNVATVAFTFTGGYANPTDLALPAAPTYEATNPAIVENAAMSLHGASNLFVQSFTMDWGNTIAPRDDVNGPSGNRGVLITGRNPTGGINPEATTVAAHDAWGRFRSATTGAFTMTIGSAANNICTISAPKVQYQGVGYGDRSGIRTWDLALGFKGNAAAGNDEFQFSFPAV